MNDNPHDPLDELLGKRPIQPSPGFTDKTLDRIKAEGDGVLSEAEFDRRLDAWLAAKPVTPGESFTGQVIAAATTAKIDPETDKVVGFPSWVVTLGGLAAALVIGALAFFALFQHGYKQAGQNNIAQTDTTAPVADTTLPGTNATQVAETNIANPEVPAPAVQEIIVIESVEPAPEPQSATVTATVDELLVADTQTQEQSDIADLILLEDALFEVAALTDAQTLDALDMLVN